MGETKKCPECGTTAMTFDPPIAIELEDGCGEMKPGTYGQNPKGGFPTCMRPKSHVNDPEDADHGYLVEYWETW